MAFGKEKVAILLALVIVASLSISGCTSPLNSGSPTTSQANATETQQPTGTSGFDPVLTKMAMELTNEYKTTVSKQPKNGTGSHDFISLAVDTPHNTTTHAQVTNYGTTAAATGVYKMFATPASGGVSTPASVTHFGEQAATVALGHTPTTVNDYYLKGTDVGTDNEYIQYDQLFVETTVTSSS
ncbi:MAG: hypothetical protein ACXV49_08170 [Halobacteriota archaeon]